jgi:C4-dicarboxylate transporter DctM subunit
MDTTPAMMVLAPILYPVAVTTLGLNPVHLGLIMVFNLSIGFITPPLGINLFVASRVGDVDLGVVIRGIIPFIIINLIVLQMITYIPEITTFLPNMFL